MTILFIHTAQGNIEGGVKKLWIGSYKMPAKDLDNVHTWESIDDFRSEYKMYSASSRN